MGTRRDPGVFTHTGGSASPHTHTRLVSITTRRVVTNAPGGLQAHQRVALDRQDNDTKGDAGPVPRGPCGNPAPHNVPVGA